MELRGKMILRRFSSVCFRGKKSFLDDIIQAGTRGVFMVFVDVLPSSICRNP
jgi:hypothetical protein